MIEQLHVIGSPVVYQLYDTRFLVREASCPRVTQLTSETLFITTIGTYLFKEVM